MSFMVYRDFPIHIGPLNGAGSYTVSIRGYLPGIQAEAAPLMETAYDPGRFRVETAAGPVDLLDLLASQRLTQQGLIQLGSALAGLLPEALRALLAESLEVVRRRGQGLRVRLNIAAPELARLPWEYLYWKPDERLADDHEHFLALQEDVSLVRHAAIDFPLPRVGLPESFRMVGALIEDPDAGLQALEPGYRGAWAQEALRLDWLHAAGRGELESALENAADLFHFDGQVVMRDGQAALVLKDGEPLAARDLARLLTAARVRLAVFGRCTAERGAFQQACHDLAGELIRRGLPAAVLGQFNLAEPAARILARELARGVLAGEPVDAALGNARRAIWRQTGRFDWGSPLLYLRVEDGVLFPRGAAVGEYAAYVEQQNVYYVVSNVDQTIGTVEAGAAVSGAALSMGRAGAAAAAARRKPRLAPPRLVTPLIGRDDELERARSGLAQGGKFYFSGVFGVGKTSLASVLFHQLIAEREYQDGYLWMRAGGRNLESLLEWIASKFDDRSVAEAEGPEAKREALQEVLSRHPDLLIGLDDIDDPGVALALLDAAGDCPVVLNGTPRTELGGRAHSLPLEPLSPQEAEQLFLSLANPAGDTPQPSDLILIRRICRKMRYLPLGVRLAALKHAEGESLETLWRRMQRAPNSLIPGDPAMRAILNTLLEDLQARPDAWQMLVRLAGFPALEASIEYLREGIDDAHFFTAKDLLFYRGAVEPAGYHRLSLHPLLAAALQDTHQEEVQAERDRIHEWLHGFTHENRWNYDLLETEQANWIGLLDFYQAAEDWDGLVRLMRDVFNFLRVRGLWQEASRRLDAVLEEPGRLEDDWSRGWAYLHRGILELLHSRDRQAAAYFDRADEVFRALDDRPYRGKTLYRRSLITIRKGEFADAAAQLEQALEWMGDRAPAHDRAAALERLASLRVNMGDLEAAQALYEQALELGEAEELARVHTALGGLARRRGDYAAAESHFEQAMALADRLGNLLQRATVYQELGHVQYYQDALEAAEPFYRSALEIYRELDYQPGIAQIEHALGNLEFSRKQYDDAAEFYRAALQRNERLGHVSRALYNRYQLAVVAQRQERAHDARNLYREVLDSAREMGNAGLQAAALYQLGNLAYEAGEKQEAIECFRQALQLAERVGERQIEARALFFTGLLQAREGHYDRARDALSQAQAASTALRDFEARRIEALLAALQSEDWIADAAAVEPGADVILPGDIIVPGAPVVEAEEDSLPSIMDTVVTGDVTGVVIEEMEFEAEDDEDDFTATGDVFGMDMEFEE